jgi:hypothetical protein
MLIKNLVVAKTEWEFPKIWKIKKPGNADLALKRGVKENRLPVGPFAG